MGIGNILPAYKLDVTGDINASANVRAASVILTSDIRYKTNIISLSGALDNLLKMNGYTYYWKDSKMGTKLQYGVIAQELEKIYPEMVDESFGKKAVNYTELIPVIIESVKEQQQIIEALKAQISEEKAKYDELQKQINELKGLLKK